MASEKNKEFQELYVPLEKEIYDRLNNIKEN